jgi:hypothetical protein
MKKKKINKMLLQLIHQLKTQIKSQQRKAAVALVKKIQNRVRIALLPS